MVMRLGDISIGYDFPPYFIADIAANHDGEIERAFKLIELAKEAGAHAAKFQNFKAETIVSRHGFKSMNSQLSHQKSWTKSVFEVYQDASIPDEWTRMLKEKCDSVSIEYMTSPYDIDSVDLADRYSSCIKIGSGDITWIGILEHIAKKQKPVLLATGASDMSDVRKAVKAIQKYNTKIVLMQCNTNYTAEDSNFDHINLNVLKTYAKEFPHAILGLSDHTPGHETVLGAIALGARVIEKHFTDDNFRDGPDHKFSMTPQSWREMVDASNKLYRALGDGEKRIEENELETALVQRRSLYLVKDLDAGDTLEACHLFPLRPASPDGFEPYDVDKVTGSTLKRKVVKGSLLASEDIT